MKKKHSLWVSALLWSPKAHHRGGRGSRCPAAPPAGTGCVILKASIVQKHIIYFQDEGSLTKKLCEQNSIFDGATNKPILHCWAWGSAKYRLTFYGNWSEKTHPKVCLSTYPQLWYERNWASGWRQDGRVEGLELNFSHKNTEITSNCWITINKKDWNLPKKIFYNHRQRRSHNKMRFSHRSEFWAPHHASQPGGLASGGGGPRALGFEGQWGLIAGTP